MARGQYGRAAAFSAKNPCASSAVHTRAATPDAALRQRTGGGFYSSTASWVRDSGGFFEK